MMMPALLEVRNATKSFPGVTALDQVSIVLGQGSIHALLGENGAGKSTLIKIITGVYRPDSGSLLRNGKVVHLNSPRDAIKSGIGVVHQERNLVPRFSIAENVMLERSAGSPLSTVDYRSMKDGARRWLDVLGLDVDPDLPVYRLSVAQMQLVEIAKALSLDSKVLLLDEPTSSLSPSESSNLFKNLLRLRDAGTSIIFVSHKLEEVYEICDSVTVLRDGRNACDSRSLKGLDRPELVRLMIGREEKTGAWKRRDFSNAPVALELRNLDTSIGHRGVNLKVRKGEIVGLTGLVGSGRTELAKSLIGTFDITAGEIAIDGKPARIGNPSEALQRYAMGYVSEDRKREGLILEHSVLNNAGISVWAKIARRAGLLFDSDIRSLVEPILKKLDVRTPSLGQLVGRLSGGNQQKISVAKWLAAGVKILIVDEPTVGIDINSKSYMHQLLRELSDGGASLLVISSDMQEIISLADRLAVVSDYRLVGELENNYDYRTMSEAIMKLIHAMPDTNAAVL